jgi:uncharacterized membrane protein (DUF4010 family)
VTDPDLIGLLIAALGGTAVGVERQWSGHADGPRKRFAGVRTFTLLGGLAGLSAWLAAAGLAVPAGLLMAGAVALVALAYRSASRHDVDGTTEVAALVVLAAGVAAGSGAHRLASAIVALTALLLVEKSQLHALVARIDDVSLRAAARFGVMALVVLPLLPDGPYGPLGGLRPQQLWALVLFFSGLSFLGYVARRLAGPHRGYLVTGLLGGVVSSTNVTLTFARASRAEPERAPELAFGAVAANAVLYPRVIVAVAVLNAQLVAPLAMYLAAPAAIAWAVTAWGAFARAHTRTSDHFPENPLQLRAALQMVVLFQAVMMAVHTARTWFGQAGLLGSAAVLGLTDVDALTVSMARGNGLEMAPEQAALAVAVGVLSNTILKLGVAVAVGSGRFRLLAALTLAAMATVAAASIAWL